MEAYYPPTNFYFKVSIPGVNANVDYAFQEVSGLNVEMTFEEIAEGGENRFKHKVPSGIKQTNLTLKRGFVTSDSKLAEWCKKTVFSDLSAKIETKDVAVLLLNPSGKAIMSWVFTGAWPVKWSFTDLESSKGEIMIESIEFAYKFLKLGN